MKSPKPRQTIYDIAREMHLSPSTISKILHHTGKVSQATRKRVLEYVKQAGFVANSNARILKSKHSWTIGIVFSDIALFGLEHPFFGSVLQAFKNDVEEKGFEVVFIVKKLGQAELTYEEWCLNKNVDGVLLLTGDLNDPDIIGLVDSDIPCVSADIIMPGLFSTMSDDKMGIELGFNHVFELGCRKIGAYCGPWSSRAYAERTAAYRELVASHGLPYDESHFSSISGYGYQNAYDNAFKFIDGWKTPPEAVLAFSDELAMGLINALKQRGYRVPEDISVVGYDDIAFAGLFNPPLTTIRQNKVAIAKSAADLLLRLINGTLTHENNENLVRRIPVQLIVRGSTKLKS